VELFPTYNMIFLKNDMLKYLNINLGLSFGI